MKKKVTFEKKVELSTKVGEITAISLEPDLTFVDDKNITGDLILNGRYKLSEASRLEEEFEYKIPIKITLTTGVDIKTGNIEITDFSYTLEDENNIICDIELLVEGEEQEEIVEELERECDGEEVEIEIPSIEKIGDDSEEVEEIETEEEYTLFSNLSDTDETYGTFIVYIVRGGETINSVLEKYKTTVEELEKYNELKDLKEGTKLIIPITNE